MHIHIAHFDSSRSVAGVERSNWLVRKLARAEQLSTAPSTPTRILGEGFYDVRRFSSTPLGRPPKNWARVYAVFVPTADPVRDLGVSWLYCWVVVDLCYMSQVLCIKQACLCFRA